MRLRTWRDYARMVARGRMTRIYVYVWFDIEDYVTKESDGLPLIAFEILEKCSVPVTCKIVAEKIRRLEENGRTDVISAISRHDVGYHLDTHSQHPTLYEYLADLDILAGAEQFLARETAGLDKARQTFSRDPSCFGHPGPTWAPHVYPALAKMKIPVYLDETPILNLESQPYWYCGVLNLNGANRNFLSFDYTFEHENGLELLKRRFKRIHGTLRKKGGGTVSVLFHLHTFINREFWDESNFANGKNPRKEDYKRPPTQPKEITERAWKNFEEFIRYMSSFKDVEFITATDAARIYHRQAHANLDKQQLEKIAKHFSHSNKYMKLENDFISPAEAFYVVTKALISHSTGSTPERLEVKEPLGPMAPFRTVGKRQVRTDDFVTAAKVAVNFIDSQNCLPTSISIDSHAELSPHDFLATACRLLLVTLSDRPLSKEIKLSTSRTPNTSCINSASFRKACKWKVLPHGFQAPKILEQIRLQAWTLRPATATETPENTDPVRFRPEPVQL